MNQVYRLLNFHKALESFNKRVLIPNCFPNSIFLETTNYCNLSCPLCPIGSRKMTRDKGFMSLKTAEQVFEEISDYVDDVVLSFYGEPFLHPQITPIVKLGKSYQNKIKIFSNLNVSPTEGWKTFVQTGIDHIVVSLDAVDPKSYSSYRVGGSFDKIISNLKLLLKTREEEKALTPVIEVQMLALKQNENQWIQYMDLCKDLGVDIVKLKYTNLGDEPTEKIANQFLPLNDNYHYYDKDNIPEINPVLLNNIQDGPCKELYLGPAIISWNGDFILCCRDHNQSIDLGSISEKTIWDFWNGEDMAIIRGNNKYQDTQLNMCFNCPAMFLRDFSIKRTFINLDLSPLKHYSCEPILKQSLSAEEYSDLTNPRLNLDDIEIEPIDIEIMETSKRKFERGNIIDYGSYRTFKI